MAESSRFQKTVELIKQRAIPILRVVFGTRNPMAFVLLAIFFPSGFRLVGIDIPDDVADFIFGISAIISVFLDPLFMYVPLINEDTKCVMLDYRLKISAIFFRLLGDIKYVFRIYFRIKRGLRESRHRPESHSLMKIPMTVANDMVCILPIPQVVILIFLPKMRELRSLKTMKFLNSLILLQYLSRSYPIFKMCMRVNKDMVGLFKKKTKDMLDDKKLPIRIPKWFGIAVNIHGYILAGHVLGAFWYFFSIQRVIDCWGYACRIEVGCEFSTSCVENTFRNITHIKNLCPINPPNATVFDFGIFIYALQSGMQGSTNFPKKFLQCFSWGLRNLSSFASNLNSSAYGWENVFVVVISISGLVLFMYLLGHTQTYMQETDRRGSVKRKMKMIMKPKIQSLLSEYDLPNHMESDMKRAVKLILEKDEDFIVENMFSILSFNLPDERQDYKEFLGFRIKCELFMGKLEKVDGLKHKDKKLLKIICAILEPMIYMEGSYIIREGEPLDMMFFVTRGNVLTYRTKTNNGTIELIEKVEGSWYGEELLTWAERSSSKLSTLPISTVTVKSHNKVEVFALKALKALKALNARNLQDVVSKLVPEIIKMESGQCTSSNI